MSSPKQCSLSNCITTYANEFYLILQLNISAITQPQQPAIQIQTIASWLNSLNSGTLVNINENANRSANGNGETAIQRHVLVPNRNDSNTSGRQHSTRHFLL